MTNPMTDTLTEMTPRPRLVCFDMAGTTVDDGPAVMECFAVAADELGLTGTARADAMAYADETMGQSKIEVFRAIFGDEARAESANAAFERAYEAVVAEGRLRPVVGAEATFEWCRANEIAICLTTGFAPTTRDAILGALGWRGVADLVLSPADAGRGRPYPDMILTAVLRLGITSVAEVVVVGDTASDLISGERAGASVIIGVLTGAHGRAEFETVAATVPHTRIIDSVADLPGVLEPFLGA